MRKNIPKSLSRRLLLLRLFPKIHSKSEQQVERNINSIYEATVSIIHNMCEQFIVANFDLIKSYKAELANPSKAETLPLQVDVDESMSITKRKRIQAANEKAVANRNSMIEASKDNEVTLQTREEEFAHSVNSVLQEVESGIEIYLSKINADDTANPFNDFVFDRAFIYKFSMKEVIQYENI